MKSSSNLKGLFFASFGAISWGVSGVCGQYLFMNYDIDSSWVTAIRMILSGILLLILGAFKEKDKVLKIWTVPRDLAWLMIAIIIVIGTALGFSVFLEGVKHIGPVKATLIGCLEPASATLLASIFLGMRFSLVELAGFFCIILTVFLSVKDKPRENKA